MEARRLSLCSWNKGTCIFILYGTPQITQPALRRRGIWRSDRAIEQRHRAAGLGVQESLVGKQDGILQQLHEARHRSVGSSRNWWGMAMAGENRGALRDKGTTGARERQFRWSKGRRVEKEPKPMSRYTTRNRFGRTQVQKDVGSWKIWPE